MVSLPSYSQRSSEKNKETCIVPCYTLRNALQINEEKKLLEVIVVDLKDSLIVYKNIDDKQISLIEKQKKEITVLEDNTKKLEKIITSKDKIIEQCNRDIKKQKTYKWIGYSTTILSIITLFYLNG
jgi:hypothetical protein